MAEDQKKTAAVSFRLTNEEVEWIDKMAEALSNRVGVDISRAQVVQRIVRSTIKRENTLREKKQEIEQSYFNRIELLRKCRWDVELLNAFRKPEEFDMYSDMLDDLFYAATLDSPVDFLNRADDKLSEFMKRREKAEMNDQEPKT